MGSSRVNGLTKNIKIVICLFFHPIRYFMVRFGCFKLKSGFSRKLSTLLNPFAPGNLAKKNCMEAS